MQPELVQAGHKPHNQNDILLTSWSEHAYDYMSHGDADTHAGCTQKPTANAAGDAAGVRVTARSAQSMQPSTLQLVVHQHMR